MYLPHIDSKTEGPLGRLSRWALGVGAALLLGAGMIAGAVGPALGHGGDTRDSVYNRDDVYRGHGHGHDRGCGKKLGHVKAHAGNTQAPADRAGKRGSKAKSPAKRPNGKAKSQAKRANGKGKSQAKRANSKAKSKAKHSRGNGKQKAHNKRGKGHGKSHGKGKAKAKHGKAHGKRR